MTCIEEKIGLMSISSLHDPSIQELQHVFQETEEWLVRAGKNVIRTFFLGLIQRNQDVNLLRRLVSLFSSASQKDFIYTRSRCNPGLAADAKTKSPKKEFSSELIDQCASRTLRWYSGVNNHIKVLFLLFIARLCSDTGMAHQACNLCKTLLNRRSVKLISDQAEEELEEDDQSLESSRYSFRTDEHPEIYQLVAVVPEYSHVDVAALMKSKHEPQNLKDECTKCKDMERLSTSTNVVSEDSHVCLIGTSHKALSTISKCCDFLSLLPVHLSKGILGMLSRSDLANCALVDSRWHELVNQIRSDEFSLQIIKEEAILMQGISAKGSNPNFAKVRHVLVPVVDEVTNDIVKLDPVEMAKRSQQRISEDGERTFESSFRGLETKFAAVEERNVYCGAYNLLVLDHRFNANRIISYAGDDNMVITLADKAIRTVEISSGRERKPSMHGHPASVTTLYMGTIGQGCVFSGSYDTTIRKWNLTTGSCQLIMYGHRKSITCLDVSEDSLASASQDGLVKVWNMMTGTCICTFKHSKKATVTCVQIQGATIVSSCEKGYIKVWNLETRKLVKVLNNHGGQRVNCIRFNEYFLVSGGDDGYLLLWSLPGRQCICLKAYRHSKAVLCVELKYMCAITGCADGKIRVINMLSGDCLRVLRGNSQCDPITAMIATENRILVNTCSNCLVMHFEPIEWEYNSEPGQLDEDGPVKRPQRPLSSASHARSVVRANRMNLTSTSDERIFKRTCSAPIASSQKLKLKQALHSAPVKRPASHYIDLQPEFRRPKSVPSMGSAATSRRSDSAKPKDVLSNFSQRVKSAKSDSSSPEKQWFKRKYSRPGRDSLLMRVGMLQNIRKCSPHNVNAEINSISYFDRFYPRNTTPPPQLKLPAAYNDNKIPSRLIGKFTSDEEIIDVKSVLKEKVNTGKDEKKTKPTTVPHPKLNRVDRNFTPRDERLEPTDTRSIQVNSFLSQQLGI